MPLSTSDRDQLVGSVLHSSDGTKIGKVNDVYLDTVTGEPEWALVHTGLFGGRESFVPLTDAGMTGRTVTVPYDKELVRAAPQVEPDAELTEAEEAELYRHYGLVWESEAVDATSPTRRDSERAAPVAPAPPVAAAPTAPMPAPVPAPAPAAGDASVVRSEERLRVGVVARPSRSVRLRKSIVTENVTVTVPVSYERATVTREPITGADAARVGVELGEDEREVVLHAEQPVVDKDVVPVERVRLGTEVVTEDETVTEEVRSEQIEVVDPTAPTAGDDTGTTSTTRRR